MYSKNLFESINLIEAMLIVGAQSNELDSKKYFFIFLLFISIIL